MTLLNFTSLRSLAIGAVALTLGSGAADASELPARLAAVTDLTPSTNPGPSLKLNEAVARALELHPDLVAATTRISKTELTTVDLEAQRFAVSADLSGRVLASQGNILRLPPSSEASTALPSALPIAAGIVGITVPIFTGFKLKESIAAAHLGQQVAEAERDNLRRSISLDVVRAFWGQRQAELAAKIQQASVDQAGRGLAIANAGLEAGRLSKHDVEQAEAALLASQAELAKFSSLAQIAKLQLARLLDWPRAALDIQGDPPLTAPPVRGLGDAEIQAAFDRHPDIQAARARVAEAQATFEASKGDYWPHLSFSATYQHGNNLLDARSGSRGFGTDFAGQWDAILTARYNVFDLGKTRRAVTRSDLDVQEAVAHLKKAERRLHLDVQSAHGRMTAARSRLMTAGQAAQLAQRQVEWTLGRRQMGYGLNIEVDDARGKLVMTELQRLSAGIDFVVAKADLEAGLGRIVEEGNSL